MRKTGLLILLLTILIRVTGCVSQNIVLPGRGQEIIDDNGRTQLLQLKNIITDGDEKAENSSVPRSDKAPYSLEILTEQDSEVIFITSMGDKKAIESRLHSEVMESPAWKSIAAVRNKKVFYLPDELFLLNPGLQYPQAVTYMAEQLYPEVKKDKGETAK